MAPNRCVLCGERERREPPSARATQRSKFDTPAEWWRSDGREHRGIARFTEWAAQRGGPGREMNEEKVKEGEENESTGDMMVVGSASVARARWSNA